MLVENTKLNESENFHDINIDKKKKKYLACPCMPIYVLSEGNSYKDLISKEQYNIISHKGEKIIS